jgi:hypothetical protein
MKKLIVTFAIAALALPLAFAQTSKTKSGTKTQQTATMSSKAVRHPVALASVPEPARDAITQAIGAGKITKLVSVTTAGTVSGYEAVVTTGKKRSTMKFDANGNHA